MERGNKCELIYTPPKADWLNIIEKEFSAISRLCLARRIPGKAELEASKAELEKEVTAIAKERSGKAIKINRRFSSEKARTKLNRYYEKVNPENVKHLKF